MKTGREFQLALGKLLDRVRVNNSWSESSFKEASTHVVGVSKSEAYRFYKALVDMNLLKPSTDKRKLTPNFDVIIWKNEDRKLGLIRELLEMFPIEQHRGRVKGKSYPKKNVAPVVTTMAEVAVVLKEEINPLSAFSAQDLVRELRDRGYVVTATRQVMVQEEL